MSDAPSVTYGCSAYGGRRAISARRFRADVVAQDRVSATAAALERHGSNDATDVSKRAVCSLTSRAE
jgi:hypothetical protein